MLQPERNTSAVHGSPNIYLIA